MSLWNSSYETGNEMVDNDHKEIFRLVQNVLSSSGMQRGDKVKTAINFLSSYVVNHFANEEKLMDECEYPAAAEHKYEHNVFLNVASELKAKFENNTLTLGEFKDGDNFNLGMEVNKVVITWLTKHIAGSDKKLATYYREWAER
ncbi:MAG: bacteriohemerythrin [Defluviitaleaceae bacterium]|nr:bacteriohemerythrin [Defluviitaleaceae bacterium]